jgi:hypothetical protein
MTSRLVSSEWSEFGHFKHATDVFKIGLFDKNRANTGSSSECVQFYDKGSAGRYLILNV